MDDKREKYTEPIYVLRCVQLRRWLQRPALEFWCEVAPVTKLHVINVYRWRGGTYTRILDIR
jgi:hypothetical protein